MKINEATYEELKLDLQKCNDYMLLCLIMFANGELMSRADKNLLGTGFTE